MLGVDLGAAFRELQEDAAEEGGDPYAIDFAELSVWAPFRLCGVGAL
jgi:hypothetical protein